MKKTIAIILIMIFAFGYKIPSYAQNEEIDPMGINVYENSMSREEYYSQTMAQYSSYDYSDPNLTTDEELFGVWDGENWTIEPLLDYDNFPLLGEIEEAAKNANGDYTECKRLTLDYYSNKFEGFNLDNSTNVKTVNRLSAEMRFENWNTRPAYGPAPISKLLVGRDPRWITATVLDAVSPIVAAPDKRITIHLYALKKDGYTAHFDSKESENCPYIEATVNGVARKFYAVADTYVSSGDNREVNFSAENEILTEESYTTIGLDTPVDSYTRRGVLKFDFSSLNDTDEVTSAILHIKGYMDKSDNPVNSDIEKNSKIVFVMSDSTVNTWEEEAITWKNYIETASWVCFSYEGTAGYRNVDPSTEYNGLVNYQASIMSFGHDMRFFVQYYAATKDETFAYHIIRESMHKIRELNCEFASTEQPTLNLIRVQDLISVMDGLKYSEHMTPEIFVAMLKNCYEHAEAIVGSERFKGVRDKIWHVNVKTGNIGALQTSALLEVAIVFNEFKAANAPLGEKWREDAHGGGWIEVAKTRFEACIGASLKPDGSATDIPLNYVWTNIQNYVKPLQNYQTYYNYDVTQVMGEDVRTKVLSAGEYLYRMCNPLYGQWQVGDGGAWNSKLDFIARYMIKVWSDDISEHMRYIATNGREGSLPTEYTSCASDYVNRAVLRSDWGQDAVALHIQSNSNEHHTHSDDLSVTIVAYGNNLLADMLRYTYTNDPISNWQMTREAHNSIVVDRADAAKTGGSLHPENREFNNVYDFINADSASYTNQFMNRYVCFVKPGYFIVTDHVKSADGNSHNYRQNWHFSPDANISVNESGQTVTDFYGKANLTVAPIAQNGELEPEICDGYYSTSSNASEVTGTKYVSYNKDVQGDTTFQTILYPTQIGETVDIQTEVLSTSIPSPYTRAMRSIIKDSKNRETELNYYILLDDTRKAPVTYGDFKTDGSMSLSEYVNEKLSTLILRKGSYIENTITGRKILVSVNEVEDVGISIDNTDMNIESSKESIDALNGMTVYVGDKKITSVTFNGETVTFGKQGKYIYVGNSPAYNLPADDTDEDDAEQNNTDDSTYVPKDEISGGSVGGGGSSSGGGGAPKGEKEEEKKEEQEENNNFEKIEIPQYVHSELENHWGKEQITALCEKGLVTGDGSSLRLSDNISRAEFVAVIVRLLDIDASYKNVFSDVSENSWYSSYVTAASELGIISGFDGRFMPDNNITREEMCKIVVGVYEKYSDKTLSSYHTFADKAEISQWADESVGKAYNSGLINGMGDNLFMPKNNALREQAFVVISRLSDMLDTLRSQD